ncbi:MAG: hypothetical protein ABIT71_01330 [Vicinamibacteraceae bacterium]
MGPFRTLTRLGLVSAAILIVASPALAQRARAAGEPLVVGGTLGTAVSSGDAYPAGPEISGLIEFPLRDDLRLRGEVGLGFWSDDLPPFDDISDGDLRRHRITGSVIKVLRAPLTRRRLGYYVGGGAGLYFYRFAERDDSSGFGVHGLGGVEYLLPHGGNRWLVGGEAQLQIIGSPEGPADDDLLKVLHLAAVVKYRLPR